ncbi:MAG: dTDP-4-dehydrorhamnose 3,5-epimerase family protein [Nitrospirota bacterium]
MEGVEVKELNLYKDNRGWLGEILRDDESELKPTMSYLSMTNPGLVRGPHEHREQTDCFCFIGKFKLYLWDNRKESATYKKHQIFETSYNPIIAIVPPGIVHAYKNIDRREGFVINMPDKLYKGWGKAEEVDEIRYENDPESPFKIED